MKNERKKEHAYLTNIQEAQKVYLKANFRLMSSRLIICNHFLALYPGVGSGVYLSNRARNPTKIPENF